MNYTNLKELSLYIIMLLFVASSCKNSTNTAAEQKEKVVTSAPFFKLSLAQWSLHKTFNDQGVDPFKFAEMSKAMGFEGLEYVNHLYAKQIEELGFDTVIDSLKSLSEKNGMQNVLIMVDNEGDLADPDEDVRDAAVENHKKWIDAAAKLGAHAIRVNTFGTNDPEIWKTAVVDGLKKLSMYAATKNINVLCENHGWLSSDAEKLMQAITAVNMTNCGTLPDFGNWCTKRKDKTAKWGECEEVYPDKYKGTALMMAAAKAVSAKSYDFDENGNETTIDYTKMLQIVKDAGYTGFVGVEYEGSRLDETAGTKATKDLLLKAAKEVK
ncbi:sugar phosphate isomerase/epimerase family protein [Polaribacter sp.]|jgi:sugar phosphate isomerase/epimerase|uniref:sugar phosphate isomerase/epimerase family protein n=1 Tax=Polaribacter sp. TaxID=1920175 RepID=UPI003EE9BB80